MSNSKVCEKLLFALITIYIIEMLCLMAAFVLQDSDTIRIIIVTGIGTVICALVVVLVQMKIEGY